MANKTVYAHTLSELLDRRKGARSTRELEALCAEYGVEPSKLESLARFVNSPSINSATIRPVAGKSEEKGFMATVCVFCTMHASFARLLNFVSCLLGGLDRASSG